MDIPATKLFLGHFGICDRPKEVMQRALDRMQRLLDIGAKFAEERNAEDIAHGVIAGVMPEVEKLRKARGESLYKYMSQELVPSMSMAFANYYLELQAKQ